MILHPGLRSAIELGPAIDRQFGTSEELRLLHYRLWNSTSADAGILRSDELVIDGQRRTPPIYLTQALEALDGIDLVDLQSLARKGVELNFCHPFAAMWPSTLVAYVDWAVRGLTGRYVDWRVIGEQQWEEALSATPLQYELLAELIAQALCDTPPQLEYDDDAIDTVPPVTSAEPDAVNGKVDHAKIEAMAREVAAELAHGSEVYVNPATLQWQSFLDTNDPAYDSWLEPDRQKRRQMVEQWTDKLHILPPDSAQMLAMMQGFCDEQPHDSKEYRLLHRGLSGDTPEDSFGFYIDRLNLQRKWHTYKLKSLTNLILSKLT